MYISLIVHVLLFGNLRPFCDCKVTNIDVVYLKIEKSIALHFKQKQDIKNTSGWFTVGPVGSSYSAT